MVLCKFAGGSGPVDVVEVLKGAADVKGRYQSLDATLGGLWWVELYEDSLQTGVWVLTALEVWWTRPELLPETRL